MGRGMAGDGEGSFLGQGLFGGSCALVTGLGGLPEPVNH